MFKSVVAYSEDPVPGEAAQDLLQSVNKDLDGMQPQAGMLFVSYQMDPAPIASIIRETFPGIELIGCSTEGNISSSGGYMQNGVVLLLFAADNIVIRAAVCRELSTDARASAATAIGGVLAEGEQAAFCIALPESLTIGGDAVIDAIQGTLAKNVPIFGGLSADNWTMDATFQIYNEEVLHDAAPLLMFIDSPVLKFSYGVKSGWRPLGEHGTITRVTGNRVDEIDHKPAAEYYKHYFGDTFQILGEFPLLVETETGEFLRAPLTHDEDTGAIMFAGDLPAGAKVRIATAKQDVIVDAVDDAVGDAMAKYDGVPDVAMIYTCAARHYILKTKTPLEIERSMNLLGNNLTVAGFYTFGEFAPGTEGKSVCMHNETFTVLLVGEVAPV